MGIPIDSTYNPGRAVQRSDMRPEIGLRSGAAFDFIHPWRNKFGLEEIAWGLARTCRWGGQLRDNIYYSVAEHSLWVSYMLPEELQWQGLMHDAHEAFMGDMTRPLKQLLPDYRNVERRVERAVLDRCGIDKISPLVRHIDLVAQATEERDLMIRSPELGPSDIQRMGIKPSPRKISNLMGYEDAAVLFMSWAWRLLDNGLVPQQAIGPIFKGER